MYWRSNLMDENKLKLISQLMEELEEAMELGREDIESRLGRKKEEEEVVLPKDEAIEEHERLVSVLKSPDQSDNLEEAEEQGEELDEMLGEEKEAPAPSEDSDDALMARIMKMRS